MTSKVSAVEMKSAKSNVIIKAFQIYYMYRHAETSVLDLCTIMQSWRSQRIIIYTPYSHGGVRDFGIGSRKAY